jgi:allantoinase
VSALRSEAPPAPPLVVRSDRVVLPDGVRAAAVLLRGGRIASIAPRDARAGDASDIDAGDLVVLPGLVDTHVHVNDPGRAHWEGFDHATRAAAAGGVTTIVDMPLNTIPPTTTLEGLDAKRRAAAGRCHIDVGFWGGVVPGSASSIEPLAEAGVLGFKCFLCPSGVAEFPHVTVADLQQPARVLARLGLPLLVHAELPERLTDPARREPAPDPRGYETWLASRPPDAEHAAIDLLIDLARTTGCRVHVVHLASADALEAIAAAKGRGVRITVETCPHYLTFAAEDIRDGATAWKCAPPIRERRHREGLWQGLAEHVIDFVASDHSPAPPELKRVTDGDFLQAWGGIASLQLGLSIAWTAAAPRGFGFEDIARWLAERPAALAGLGGRKGRIAEGCDGDLVVWDPDPARRVDAPSLYHRHAVTPYAGMVLRGAVLQTILRGQVVYDGTCRQVPAGRLIERRDAFV